MDYEQYNALPTLEQANEAFTPQDRDRILPKLTQLFNTPAYRDTYAFGLVHRHFELKSGEQMVTTNLVTSPEILNPQDPTVVPDRWTADGVAFEYTRLNPGATATPVPSAELLKAFRAIVGPELGRYVGIFTNPKLGPGRTLMDGTENAEKRQQSLRIVDILSRAGCSCGPGGGCECGACPDPKACEHWITAAWFAYQGEDSNMAVAMECVKCNIRCP
ncbi:hypothetical protein CC1G_02685 [Coprinopsis cinerea okayama7|uniref:Uncharacterized protein n=1 Tax=Coprinopsis cinerea (strain Okayama-7 / 130 / ATCC MYA-4618 / FGSC 9003) TaxID=240176 RepID=A8PBM7_COPC7|nr:hypothetical protein CC1G_02685 [Coprinopsis cinerea okayama7\|eukprot:XP_001840222.2 hypothetical protein CC1G_02685 [Coprinopsis cinerea okayama7\